MRRSWQAISLRLVGVVQVEMGVAMEMTKERLAGAIKVGFAQWRVDYTETVYDDLICLETEGESRHAAIGKYHVKSTVFDERVLPSIAS